MNALLIRISTTTPFAHTSQLSNVLPQPTHIINARHLAV